MGFLQDLGGNIGALPDFISSSLYPKPQQNYLTPQAQKSIAGNPNHFAIQPEVKSQYVPNGISPTPSKPIDTLANSFSGTKTPLSQDNSESTGGVRGRIPVTNRMNVDPVVDDAISKASGEYGVPKDLMYDIGFSESSLNSQKPPNELNHAGLYQFDPSTWNTVLNYGKMPGNTLKVPNPNKDYMDPYNAAYGAAYLIKHGQLGKWDASDWNWGQHYTPTELEGKGFYSQDTTHTPGKFYADLHPHS